jgi:hypothetical protein
MRRLLLVTSVLCAIDTTQAFAQHEVSQQLLELEEADRNTFFTMQLRGSNKRCDQVIRTLFNAAYLDVDEWEALCRDHNSYSLNVPADPDATITSLHCRELSTTSKMLLQSVGSKNKASGCKIKGERRKRHWPRAKQADSAESKALWRWSRLDHRSTPLAIDQTGPDLEVVHGLHD